ncbi:MAG: aldehyde dehydrogenase family protein [Acidimicrobiia bacterium]|nr:aldehyde dehydrogenase family protein [Acidimicrobiia bacterium]
MRKTHKLYINGAFPRSESGRVFPATDADGEVVARMAQASRKDLRDAVRAARGAQAGWAGRTAYNRAQILYRVAEMVEDRREAFAAHLAIDGRDDADAEIEASIDRLVWYAGWADKFPQVFGNLNPVAGPFFNISVPEATGVIGVAAPDAPPLLGLVSVVAPVIVSGNTAVVIPSERWPLTAITFAEALATSDVPGGVVNLLTGFREELLPWLGGHMDVNGLDLDGAPAEMVGPLVDAGAENLKRTRTTHTEDWWSDDAQSPYRIAAFTETKTVWHPKGR